VIEHKSLHVVWLNLI